VAPYVTLKPVDQLWLLATRRPYNSDHTVVLRPEQINVALTRVVCSCPSPVIDWLLLLQLYLVACSSIATNKRADCRCIDVRTVTGINYIFVTCPTNSGPVTKLHQSSEAHHDHVA